MTILSGSADTDNGVILTVEAGHQWNGSVTLSAAHTAAVGSGLANKRPNVFIDGTGADPVDGSLVAAVALATPLVNLLSLLGPTSANSVTVPNVYVIATTHDVELKLDTDGASAAVATAFGFYT